MNPSKSLRHSNNTIQIPFNEILPGDLVWTSGELFKASEVFGYKNERNQVVIRFIGKSVKGYNSVEGTHFDGGMYGGRADIMATIVKRELATK